MTPISWTFPYPTRRMPVFADQAVATSQPLAAAAGIRALAAGGNAVDAALATAITLTVVEPTSNGIGSDAFALIWDGGRLHGINGSGRSPAGWTPERFGGLTRIPPFGWDSVTVPGAVDVWARLSARFGRLPFADLFTPAIRYARDGFVVSPVTAAAWAAWPEPDNQLPGFVRTFLPYGRAPQPGDRFRCPDQAETLAAIADSRGESFYRGDLARRIVRQAEAEGGAMTLADLADHEADWVTPISVDYRDVRLHEIPPNGQGIAALIALGILSHFDLPALPPDSADALHLQIEAMKIAFAEVNRHLADPDHMTVSPQALIDPEVLAGHARTIRMDRAAPAGGSPPAEPGTVYLTAADADGMMVSYIQSNFAGFGSGVVIDGTGISLQNRGVGFSLTPGHPNQVGPRKRPFHTIIPGFVTRRDGTPLMSFGVMGGHMQPQGHVQMIVRIADFGQNPQAACDAPRWHVCPDGRVAVEPEFDPAVIETLSRRGHWIDTTPPRFGFGGAQLILKLDSGGYCAASDGRKDGMAMGF